jgi:Arc/MetJ-type ribon-helix-helix transcriptional regulator
MSIQTDEEERSVDAKPRLPETEKITINLGLIDLGQIDLLVQEGFFNNRSDFIRTAIRAQLLAHADTVRQTAVRKMFVMGVQDITAADLVAAQHAGTRLRIRGLGLVRIADDVTPALAAETIESVEVLGALHASAAVKELLASRIK